MRPASMERLSSHITVRESWEVAARVLESSGLESPARARALSTPREIMYTDWAAVSWIDWERSMRSYCRVRSRSVALNRPDRSNLATRLTASTTVYITPTLTTRTMSYRAIRSRPSPAVMDTAE